MLWIFAARFFMAALRQCEKSEGCFAVFTAQPWTAAVLFKLQFSDGLLEHNLVPVAGIERFDFPSDLPPHMVGSFQLAGILLRTCARPNLKTVFSFSRNWLPGWHLWKTCIVFAVIESSRLDTNLSLYICSRRPWE